MNHPELGLYREPKASDNVQWLVSFLEGRDWTTAAEILAQVNRPPTENNKRQIRAWADASEGRVIGHQRGYRLTRSMTGEEYGHWRNEATKAADAIRGRVLETDHVFYGRKAA